MAAGAVADLKHRAVKLFGKTHDIRSQKTGFKLKRASLLSELVCHKAGRGNPKDHEGNLAVFLAVTRVIKVGELGLGPKGSRLCPVTLAYSCIAASTFRKVCTTWPCRRSSPLIKSRRSVRFRDHDACAACTVRLLCRDQAFTRAPPTLAILLFHNISRIDPLLNKSVFRCHGESNI